MKEYAWLPLQALLLLAKEIAAKASQRLKKYTLEMGGKNPLILLKDFDVEQAVKIAGFGAVFSIRDRYVCVLPG